MFGYTPRAWQSSKVIYIPKIGKTDYEVAKSYRPIILTSCLLKGLEKLVYWNLEATTLKDRPYNASQHALRAGKSTESALSEITNEIEKGTLRRGYTLAVFLDCARAFDNMSFRAAERALKKKKVHPQLIKWYMNYLKHRTSSIELKGIQRQISIDTSCPQGGILSVMLWNITFDQLLNKFSKGRVKCIGFADDGTLLSMSKTCIK